jgi:hypothetical protein
MRYLGRLVAAALVGSAAGALAGGAGASAATPPPPGPAIAITAVNGGKPITSGAPQFTVKGTATPDAKWDLKMVVVSIDGVDGKPFGAPLTITGTTSAFTAQFPNGPPAITRNGTYAIHVTATETPNAKAQGCLGQGSLILPCPADHSTSAGSSAPIALQPAAVKGLTVSPPDATRAVTLKWDANPEPDIIEYVVYRQAPGEKVASPIGATTATTATDLKPPAEGGKVAYTVAAVRAGVSGKTDPQSCGVDLSGCVLGGQATAQSVDVPVDPAAATSNTPNTLANGTPAAVPNLAANGPGPALPVPIVPGVHLNGAKSLGAGPPPTLADGTFAPTLPFQPGSANDKEEGPPDAVVSQVGRQLAGNGRSRPFLLWPAAALLVVVLAMHLLWLRREVNRKPTDGLAPLPPGGDDAAASTAAGPAVPATSAALGGDEPAAWLGPQAEIWAPRGSSVREGPPLHHVGGGDLDGAPTLDDFDDVDADGGDLPVLDDRRPDVATASDDPAPARAGRLLVSIGGRRPG